MSLKVPCAVRQSLFALENDKSVVIGLQSTGTANPEKIFDSYLTKLSLTSQSLDGAPVYFSIALLAIVIAVTTSVVTVRQLLIDACICQSSPRRHCSPVSACLLLLLETVITALI